MNQPRIPKKSYRRAVALEGGMRALALKLKAIGDHLMKLDDAGSLNAAYVTFRAADEATISADRAKGLTDRELRTRKNECRIGHSVLMTAALVDCASARIAGRHPKAQASLRAIAELAEALLDAAMVQTYPASPKRAPLKASCGRAATQIMTVAA